MLTARAAALPLTWHFMMSAQCRRLVTRLGILDA
jgi:hypothetical protein